MTWLRKVLPTLAILAWWASLLRWWMILVASGLVLAFLATSAALAVSTARRELATVPRHHPPCHHHGAVEVRRTPVPAVGIGDDRVAWWCPECETQLPAEWTRPKCRVFPVETFEEIQAAGFVPLKVEAYGRPVRFIRGPRIGT